MKLIEKKSFSGHPFYNVQTDRAESIGYIHFYENEWLFSTWDDRVFAVDDLILISEFMKRLIHNDNMRNEMDTSSGA